MGSPVSSPFGRRREKRCASSLDASSQLSPVACGGDPEMNRKERRTKQTIFARKQGWCEILATPPRKRIGDRITTREKIGSRIYILCKTSISRERPIAEPNGGCSTSNGTLFPTIVAAESRREFAKTTIVMAFSLAMWSRHLCTAAGYLEFDRRFPLGVRSRLGVLGQTIR